MPFYKYHCTKCNKQFEVMKSIDQMQLQEPCPKCDELSDKEFEGMATYICKCGGFYGKKSK